MCRNKYLFHRLFFCSFFLIPHLLFCQQQQPGNKDKPVSGFFQHDIPPHPYSIILSRPGDHEITISLMSSTDMEGYFAYGLVPDKLIRKTEVLSYTKEQPVLSTINSLNSDTRYYYSFCFRQKGEVSFTRSPVYSFQTRRKAGSRFVFTIQADSHLDENTSVKNYEQTMANMAADSTDFLIDLGDTWMTDKFRNNFKDALPQYIAQRYYFSRLCHSASLFLTLGNHDGEQGWGNKKNGAESILQWSTAMRNFFYRNPYPDGFYSGNPEKLPSGSYTANYYAWEWGDALFIVLDPFRYTKDNRDPWQRTLGEQQYKWLKETLQQSKATFRFVFIHNLVGGADKKGIARGGAEAASFYEWGGWNADSTDGFALHRPGWEMPVHQLLIKYKVSAVFHGHDHFFARQEKDGIIYQLLPQPGGMRTGQTRQATEYGYLNGTFLNAPGYLRVSISPHQGTIEFISSANPPGKKILHSYTIPVKKQQL